MVRAVLVLPALLAGLSAANPFSLFARQDACVGNGAAGYCTTLSYQDNTDDSSQTTDDCQETCRSILSDAGDWGVDFTGKPAGYIDHMVLQACGFGIGRATDDDTSEFSFDVHNQDILDVIDESVKRFAGQHGGKVKAEGTMNCEGHVVRWYVG
ncbi:putative necrosis-inducing factor-domain-containing protein [Hypoxylon sp. FL0543]|nr:putative necrosis-inducing factor-domain-containing protein [Hypoxylon sp. FL0543]